MVDVRRLLARQAEWQKLRRQLPWPEKLRLSEEMHATLRGFEALRASEARRNRRDERTTSSPGE